MRRSGQPSLGLSGTVAGQSLSARLAESELQVSGPLPRGCSFCVEVGARPRGALSCVCTELELCFSATCAAAGGL